MRICLYCILVAAAVFDIVRYRIPNALIVPGLAAGFFLQGIYSGLPGLGTGLKSMIITLLAGLTVYILGALGAGDIKLFCLIALFLGYKKTFWIFLMSMCFGIIIGIIESLFFKDKREKSNEREKNKELIIKQRYGFKPHFVHFGPAVLVATIICMEALQI